ncbi:hypothetical protein FOMPIDRAFT_1056392 [Fomitopsis schrenkii]|uniref:Uncharacterized protein n=1 Tax=Fomitopsis schrenkii TaxID=2126942 RepID=S8F1T7_FOMSC|nr:hypothetical protein FOMPIDRAFT_1056392 [Fomitopsis schrenkii]
MQTATYSTVEKLEIKVDFKAPPSARGVLPGVIFFHGGGMVAGSRHEYAEWIVESAHAQGMIFLSADHRLIHPSTGFDIIEDMRALFAFLADPTFSEKHLPDGVFLDPTRIAVMGASGGGYAARATALYAQPKPKAVFLLYAMGGEFLSDHWLSVKPPGTSIMPGASAIDASEVASLLENALVPVAESANMIRDGGEASRILLFPYWWQTGELLDHVLGEPISAHLRALPVHARLATVPEHLRPALLETQLDATFPPTFLVHGSADTGVLPSESQATFERARELGVPVELEMVPNAPHGLLTSFSPLVLAPGAEQAQERGMKFLARYI